LTLNLLLHYLDFLDNGNYDYRNVGRNKIVMKKKDLIYLSLF
jgi:hypothetical protein